LSRVYLLSMKLLYQEINRIEQELARAPLAEQIALNLCLADLYNSKDSRLALEKTNWVLNHTTPTDSAHLKARLIGSKALVSNRKYNEAASEIKDVVEKSQDNLEVTLLAKIYLLFISPYLNTKEASDKLLVELSNDSSLFQTPTMASFFHQAASDYSREHDLQQASLHLFEAIRYTQQSDTPWTLGFLYCKLGIICDQRKEYDQAESFYADALPILTAHQSTPYLFQNYVCFSKLYIEKKDFNKAIEYADLAYEQALSIDFKPAMDFAQTHKITALLYQKRFDEVEVLANELITTANDDTAKGSYYNILSNAASQQNDIPKAIDLAYKYFELRKSAMRPQDVMSFHLKMHGFHSKVNNYKEALYHLEQKHDLEIKRLDESRMKAVSEMQTKYEVEKREAELKEARLQQTESELKALKAQMNPHFIFNALNSIQEIFFLGDKRLANKHLSNFSQLTRKILHASSKKNVTLQEEIEMLEQYLSLEALRFSGDFTYGIELTDSVDPYLIDIPPMLLQPFVENAVKHGLMHKEKDRRLAINFSLEEKENDIHLLLATIIDNGIGREASTKINTNKKRIGQSFASEATEKRLALLNTENHQNATVVYTDLAENNQPSGTCVLITIPVNF
jgi:two-component system LytT family sensor kinase